MSLINVKEVHIHIGKEAAASLFAKQWGMSPISNFAWDGKFKINPHPNTVAIGDKWPGTDAIYVGKALSRDGSKIIDLIYWPDFSGKGRNYADNIKYCESVSPETKSHAATRQQAIVLNDNLRHLMSKDHGYWTETKDNDGDAAFVQRFCGGYQFVSFLSNERRALAVSEIH